MITKKVDDLSDARAEINRLALINERNEAMIRDLRSRLGIAQLEFATHAINDGLIPSFAFESEIADHCFYGLQAELADETISAVESSDDDLGLKILKRAGIYYLVMIDDERVILRGAAPEWIKEVRDSIMMAMAGAICFCEDQGCTQMPEEDHGKIPGRATQLRYCTMIHCAREDLLRPEIAERFGIN